VPRFPFSLQILACLLLLLPIGCGGGSKPASDDAATVPFDVGLPGAGGAGPQLPPPAPALSFDESAVDYQRVATFGSFPSSMSVLGDTLFVTDADQIEAAGANVLAIDIGAVPPVISTKFAGVNIPASVLVDSQGNTPDLLAPIGFGYFVNDLLVVGDHLGFALVNAGGSDSSPGLSNLVVFDPLAGTLLQVVNLANPFRDGTTLLDSNGVALPTDGFQQSGAEGLAFTTHADGSLQLFVAMSNLVFGAPSNGATKYPGTIQVFAVKPLDPLPVEPINASGDVLTRTLRTEGYNPVAIMPVTVPETGAVRLLVTVAGTTDYDGDFNLVPTSEASVETFDASSGAFLGRFRLGLAGLSGIRPALGVDGTGHRVGYFPSSVTGEVYLLRLDGLYASTIDTTALAVLRGPGSGIPITAAQTGQPGGNITGVALSPDGRSLVVAGFGDLFAFPTPQPGRIFLLSLPQDVVSDPTFTAAFTPGSTEFATTPGRTVGEVVALPSGGAGPDIFVNVGGTLDASFLGNGAASLGALDTGGQIR
jgi:hypothetical protein